MSTATASRPSPPTAATGHARRARDAVAATAVRLARTPTPAGWVVVAVAALGLSAAFARGILEAAVAGGAALVLLVLAVPFLFGARAYEVGLHLEHDRVVAGTPVEARLVVTNVGRTAALPGRIDVPVGDGLVDVHVPFLRPRRTADEPVVVPTRRRGVVAVGPVRTVRGDPLGLLTREAVWDETRTLWVHPVTTALRSTATGLIRDLEGSASRTVVDADFSFHALRPYVPGDAPRQIHWKSTAKTGDLMVRQYDETRRSRMVVVLSRRDDEYADDDEFELAVSAAASLGVRGIRDGRDVDVVAGADPAGRGRSLRASATVSTRTLLDDLTLVQAAERVAPLREVAELAAAAHPDVSVAALVCGSPPPAAALQRAALAFGGDVAVLAVVCAPTAEPGLRRLGATTVLSIGLIDDLRQLLAKGARS